MTKTVEYRVVPHDRWTVVRFEREDAGASQLGGSVQRGEFANEDAANEVAALLAKAEDGATFVSRKSMNRVASGPIGTGGLSPA